MPNKRIWTNPAHTVAHLPNGAVYVTDDDARTWKPPIDQRIAYGLGRVLVFLLCAALCAIAAFLVVRAMLLTAPATSTGDASFIASALGLIACVTVLATIGAIVLYNILVFAVQAVTPRISDPHAFLIMEYARDSLDIETRDIYGELVTAEVRDRARHARTNLDAEAARKALVGLWEQAADTAFSNRQDALKAATAEQAAQTLKRDRELQANIDTILNGPNAHIAPDNGTRSPHLRSRVETEGTPQ